MIIAGKDEVIEFSPPGEDAVVYKLRIPSGMDRIRHRRALVEAGFRQWNPADMYPEIVKAIGLMFAHDDEKREHLLGLMQSYRERMVKVRETYAEQDLSDSPQALQDVLDSMRWPDEILAIEQDLQWHSPALARIAADQATMPEIFGYVSARMFVVGWSGLPIPFRGDRNGVADRVMIAIPDAHLVSIGVKVSELLQPTRDERGKSRRPSGGQSGQETSPTLKTAPQKTPSQEGTTSPDQESQSG